MGSMLRRLAPLATTGVGSLPFTRPGEAVRYAAGAYELPFCPQLPRAYGDMLQEWLGADPGRCGWAPDRDRQLPAAWDDLILELGRCPPPAGVVKLQVTGPLTLAVALERRSAGRHSAGRRADTRDLAREIAGWLAAAVSDQVRGLRDLGLGALVVIDEPGLMAAQHLGGAAAAWDALRVAAPAWGLHVCGEVPWPLVDAAEPDVISYDVVRYGCGRGAHPVIRRLMRRGGRVMWGVADPAAPDGPSLIVDRVCAAARSVAGRRWRTADVLDASLLSGTCGSGGVDVGAERRLARHLRVAAGLLRGDPLPAAEREARVSGGAERVRARTTTPAPVLTSRSAASIASGAKREIPGGKG